MYININNKNININNININNINNINTKRVSQNCELKCFFYGAELFRKFLVHVFENSSQDITGTSDHGVSSIFILFYKTLMIWISACILHYKSAIKYPNIFFIRLFIKR